jgi:hypothetical protein
VQATLLAAGIPICEHLTNLVPAGRRLRCSAVPVKANGMGTFPVRASCGSAPDSARGAWWNDDEHDRRQKGRTQ